MWTCEKCNRTFKNENQNHFCEGDKEIDTVTKYINSFDDEKIKVMLKVKEAIMEVVPDSTPYIKWSMPTFVKGKNIIHFSANKNHIGIYPGPTCIEEFKNKFEELGLKYSKGAVQIPWKSELPLDLIKEMTLYNYKNL